MCLDVTDECLKDIRNVRNRDTLREFNNKNGVLFARRVQLGGRLSCSKAKSADSKSSSKDEASKFKAAAAASISAAFYQASVKSSYETQEKRLRSQKSRISRILLLGKLREVIHFCATS